MDLNFAFSPVASIISEDGSSIFFASDNTATMTVTGVSSVNMQVAAAASIAMTTATGLFAADGEGVPVGGLTGQVLVKSSNADFATQWAAPSGGGGASAWGAITGTLGDQADLLAALNAKQPSGSYSVTGHGHVIADTTGLQTALDGKQAVGSYASAAHGHVISDTTGLQTALDGKQAAGSYANSVHGHIISDTTGLQAALDDKQASGSYAAAVHTHAIADTTGLQTALDGKASTSHTHAQADVTGLVAALAGKEPTITAGTTAQYIRGDKSLATLDKSAVGLANVDNTSDANKPVSTATTTALNGKANTSHTHAQGDVTGLVADLAAKQATLVSGTNIKTVNGTTLLGSGNIVISGGGSSVSPVISWVL